MISADGQNQSPRRVYGRRRGRRLRPGRQALLDDLLPALSVTLPDDGSLDTAGLFGFDPGEIWLEIGFGAGEHLARQARDNPAVGLIGSEIFVNGVASLLRHIEDQGLRNIRIWDEDARPLLAALPDAAVARVFLLFPDPWPKDRHADRRFVNPGNLDQFARLMADGAELRIASDHPVYQEWTLEQMSSRNEFDRLTQGEAAWNRPPDWPETRYEAKARSAGRRCMYLRYRRRCRETRATG